MKKLGLNELRGIYLDFFKQKGHQIVKSASLVPHNDKSLLLIPAGMAPLKPYFTGQEAPPSPRMASCQKCVRTNDIENVGVTSRHCTFFEMLGNFSFGDYFKEETIEWAWEFLTETLEIPAERLYPSVYFEDDEAFAIWRDRVKIPEEKIIKLGKEDNFWEHGTGPCGPCSEIYFDRGAGACPCANEDCRPGCDCDRFVEIWNLVFTQFNKNEDGSYTTLAKKNIDTGMGLERMAVVMQGVSSVHDVDTVKAIRDAICAAAGVIYGKSKEADKSVRIITDHARSVVFMLSDGIMPSNEERGYVLRKLLRRAALHAKLLGAPGNILSGIAETVIAQSSGAYPELAERKDFIIKMISTEEQRFSERLTAGVEVLKKFLAGEKGLSPRKLGEQAFIMYDTFGFPVELTRELLAGEGMEIEIDMEVFAGEMEKQRVRAREARFSADGGTSWGGEDSSFSQLASSIFTEFAGYDGTTADGEILALIAENKEVDEAVQGTEVLIFTSKTSIYAEGGGQKGDTGRITTETGQADITDCKLLGGKIAHIGKVTSGIIKREQKAKTAANAPQRAATARNHSATHLLHKALKDILGSHVEQAGSLVDAERLRFDFTHFQPLSSEEIRLVEDAVNSAVFSGHKIETAETHPDKAREMGAIALFGEKYGDTVRVVSMGGSIELCGGTHVQSTGEIGLLRIISETGIAAGVRRVEAITGQDAVASYRETETILETSANHLKTNRDNVPGKILALLQERSELLKELSKHKKDASTGIVSELLASKETIGQIAVVTGIIDEETAPGAEERRNFADALRGKLGNEAGLALLIFKNAEGNASFFAAATNNAVKQGLNCGNIVKNTVQAYGGRGGGKPDMAQGGLPGGVDFEEVLSGAKNSLKE